MRAAHTCPWSSLVYPLIYSTDVDDFRRRST
jgi:hypothetical protein